MGRYKSIFFSCLAGIVGTGLSLAEARGSGAVCVTTRIEMHGGGGGGSPAYNPASAAAAKEVRAAQTEIARVLSDLRNSFEESPEVHDAKMVLLQSASGFQNATSAALENLRQTPRYKQASDAVEQAQRRLETARRNFDNDPKITTATLDQLARELLNARAAQSRIQSEAFASDENVTAARQTWVDANGKLVALRRSFEQTIPSNSQFRAAREHLENARKQLAGIRH